VHLNPVRANFLTAEGCLRAYRWSSYPEYLKPPSRRPQWLRVERLFGEMRILKDSLVGRQQFEGLMEQRRQTEDPKQWKALRRGWCFGEEQFRAELLEQMSAKMGTHHGEVERSETTTTWSWIAFHLHMGAAGYAAQCLRKRCIEQHWNIRD